MRCPTFSVQAAGAYPAATASDDATVVTKLEGGSIRATIVGAATVATAEVEGATDGKGYVAKLDQDAAAGQGKGEQILGTAVPAVPSGDFADHHRRTHHATHDGRREVRGPVGGVGLAQSPTYTWVGGGGGEVGGMEGVGDQLLNESVFQVIMKFSV